MGRKDSASLNPENYKLNPMALTNFIISDIQTCQKSITAATQFLLEFYLIHNAFLSNLKIII